LAALKKPMLQAAERAGMEIERRENRRRQEERVVEGKEIKLPLLGGPAR
jgi:hypothetical protein